MWDVNDSGAVVGDDGVRGWLLQDGVYTPIEVAGARSTRPQGLNNLGQVVGVAEIDLDPSPDGEQLESRAFRYANGVASLIPTPPSIQSGANDINDQSVVVGFYQPDGVTLHSFLSGPGGFETVPTPAGAGFLNLTDINNVGVAVGGAVGANGQYTFWRYGGGVLSPVVIPPTAGCSQPYLLSLTEAGVASGSCGSTAFVFSGGGLQTVAVPGATFTYLFGSNSAGTIAGFYHDAVLGPQGFLLRHAELIDPVGDGDLLDGDRVTDQGDALASKGRLVHGVAADGVARVVVRIPADAPSQQYTVRLLNDRQPRVLSTSSQEDGALLALDAQQFPVSQLTVETVSTTEGAYAFVLYRAPNDFPRVGTPVASGAFGPDDNKASRQVFLEITPMGGLPYVRVVEIVRPPVLVVHGLWSNRGAWNRFSPFTSGPDLSSSRFTIQRSDYSRLVSHVAGPIEATVPEYPASDLPQIRANSLGFDFNADLVEDDIAVLVRSAKLDNNPSGLPIASVQVDVVAHSMGGAIARTIHARRQNFGWHTFGAGSLHKLITIDTPHKGSHVATQLIGPLNACMRRRITLFAPNFALQTVEISGTAGPTRGAVGDLVDSPLSDALQRISAPGVVPLPVSFVAGTYDDWSALDFALPAVALRLTCDDPLAQALTQHGWPSIFGNQPNDAIVSRSSQINDLSVGDSAVFERSGYLHSDGTAALGFSKPSILDPGHVPDFVFRALNEPTYNTLLFRPTPQ